MALEEGVPMGRKEELWVPSPDSPWVRLALLCQGLGPSEVEECVVEGQREGGVEVLLEEERGQAEVGVVQVEGATGGGSGTPGGGGGGCCAPAQGEPRESSLKRYHGEEPGNYSPKLLRMEVMRMEGGQGGCELVTSGQSRSLPACPPGLAGCSLEEELDELPKLETTMDEEDEVEQEEVKGQKEMEVEQMMRELVEEVVVAAVPRSSPAKRHQGDKPVTYGPKVPRMEVERKEESRKRKFMREEKKGEVFQGVAHSLDEVVARLEGMEKVEVLGLTNRTVLDMLSAHRPQVDEPFIQALWRALEVHSSWVDRQLRQRFRFYLVQSLTDRRAELEDAPDEQWLYVGRLLAGGDLHRRELLLPRRRESLAGLLVSLGDLVVGQRRCHKCGEEGEIPVCSCLTVRRGPLLGFQS